MVVPSYRKVFFLLFLLIMVAVGVSLFFFVRTKNSYKSVSESEDILNVSQERLLSKYAFVAEREMGVRQSPNFKTKIDLWGIFEKTEGNMFYLKVFDDLVALPLPKDNTVFKGARDPKDSIYIDITQLQKGTGIVVTVNQAEKPYMIEMIQVPFH